MTNVIHYTNAPDDIQEALANGVRVDDFLPSPDKLIFKTEKERITIAIDKRSLDLFKRYAKQHDAKYQTLINSVLGSYADRFLVK